MAKESLVVWMKKNDREAYAFWKNDLAPHLGRSIKRTREAIKLLKTLTSSPFSAFTTKNDVLKKIARTMGKYQNSIGASMTFGYLHDLAKEHERRILRQRK